MVRRPAVSARKKPRQARSRATVDAILKAAAQVFRRHGYAAGTTDRIAERAGVSVGSLYQYFPNKDALLAALAKQHFDETFERVRGIVGGPDVLSVPIDTLVRRLIEGMIALHAHEPELHRVLFEEAPLPPSIMKSFRDRQLEFVREARKLLEAHPEIRRDSAATAYVVLQAMEGLVHAFILHPPAGVEAKALTDEIVHMISMHVTHK